MCSKHTVGVRAAWLLLVATRCEGAVCAFFGVKRGDLCGSEVAVAQGADWHSEAT